MMFKSVPLTIAAIVAMVVTSQTAVAAPRDGLPTGITDRSAVDKPTCPSTPGEYWQCLSDCLYKKCATGDTACITSCDYECSVQWVPGFPGCEPSPW